MELGEIISRTGPKTTDFTSTSGASYGALTSSDIAAAIGTIKSAEAQALVVAKYIDHSAARFPLNMLISRYRYRETHSLRRIDTIQKLAIAALQFYITSPRCRRCHGYAHEWDRKELCFVPCPSCLGSGAGVLSVREIARLSGMSRSKLNDAHLCCFWRMHEILSIWEDIAAHDIRKSLKR
jgi:hypothetical protein